MAVPTEVVVARLEAEGPREGSVDRDRSRFVALYPFRAASPYDHGAI